MSDSSAPPPKAPLDPTGLGPRQWAQALEETIEDGDLATHQWLLERPPARPAQKTLDQALQWAIWDNHPRRVELALALGARANATSLHALVDSLDGRAQDFAHNARLLVLAGAELNRRLRPIEGAQRHGLAIGQTPLETMLLRSDPASDASAIALLELGADPCALSVPSEDGQFPMLHLALLYGKTQAAMEIERRGGHIVDPNGSGPDSMLLIAIYSHVPSAVAWVLGKGADPMAKFAHESRLGCATTLLALAKRELARARREFPDELQGAQTCLEMIQACAQARALRAACSGAPKAPKRAL